MMSFSWATRCVMGLLLAESAGPPTAAGGVMPTLINTTWRVKLTTVQLHESMW